MKNKIQLFVIGLAIILAMVNLESCSSYKGIASKPDGHNRYQPDFALHLFSKHNSNYYNNHGNNDAKTSANKTAIPAPSASPSMDSKTLGELNSMTASSSNDVPALKNSKDIYKILTAEERKLAKEEVDKIFAKRPILKSMVDSRLNKLDEKYPAPAQSSAEMSRAGRPDKSRP